MNRRSFLGKSLALGVTLTLLEALPSPPIANATPVSEGQAARTFVGTLFVDQDTCRSTKHRWDCAWPKVTRFESRSLCGTLRVCPGCYAGATPSLSPRSRRIVALTRSCLAQCATVPSRLGARKAAAIRMGIDPLLYLNMLADGNRWCSDCKDWHPREMMVRDGYRNGGRGGHCRNVREKRREMRAAPPPESPPEAHTQRP